MGGILHGTWLLAFYLAMHVALALTRIISLGSSLLGWCTAQRKGRPLLPSSECYRLVNASAPNYRQWEGLNHGPIFLPFVDQSSPERSYFVDIFSVPEIFVIEVQSRPKSRQKACFSTPNFFGRTPNFGPSFFLNCTHFRSCGKVSR